MKGISILTIAGVFSLLSAAVLIATITLGIAVGSSGPVVLDFGDPVVLARLAESGSTGHLLTVLALVAPTLALGAGIGWLHLAGKDRGEVQAGVLLWYLGTTFIVAQDALELAAFETLPGAFASAEAAAVPAVLALGDLAGNTIRVITLLGSALGDLGMLLIAVGLLARKGRLSWFGWIGIAVVIGRTTGLYLPALGPLRLAGFVLLQVWLIGLGIAMLRQGSRATGSTPSLPESSAVAQDRWPSHD